MSIFDAGFIMWGYLLLYTMVTVAYYVWLAARNRREARDGAAERVTEGD